MAKSTSTAPTPFDLATDPLRIVRLAIDNASEGLSVTTPDGVVIFANESAASLLGLPLDQIVGRHVWDLDPTYSFERWSATLAVLRARGRFEARGALLRPDGHEDMLEALAIMVLDEGREFVVTRTRDVTAEHLLSIERRKKDEHEREEALQRARLEGLGHRMNEIELVLTEDGAVVEANDHAVTAYGLSRDELRTRNIRDLRPPDGRGNVGAMMQRAICEGGLRFRAEHLRSDGTVFPVEVSSRPFTVNGALYLHSLVRDLTEELRVDADRHLLAGLISNMRDAVIVTDASLRITRFAGAAEAIYGVRESDVVGREPLAGIGLDASEPSSADFIARMRSGESARTSHTLRRSDGTTVDLDVIASPLRDAGGAVTGHLLVSRDVSAQKALERELRDALQSVKTLSGLVPICAWCKKIRNDEGYWDRLEHYLSEHTEAHFTHGMCPDCANKWR
ncbi:MAG: PAS domain S-box protein [Polyangiales bacterium]